MTEPKFTKGPWKADLKNTEVYIEVEPYVYMKREYQYDYSIEEEKANALLIAMAPEMYVNEEDNLEILNVLRDYLNGMLHNPVYVYMRDDLTAFVRRLSESINKTKTTLAKARGEE